MSAYSHPGKACLTLFALLDAALYDDTAEEKDAKK